MIIFLIVYISTALMVAGIIFTTTFDGFVLTNKATKVASIFVELLIGIFWFPIFIYITVWTIMKRIRSNDLQD